MFIILMKIFEKYAVSFINCRLNSVWKFSLLEWKAAPLRNTPLCTLCGKFCLKLKNFVQTREASFHQLTFATQWASLSYVTLLLRHKASLCEKLFAVKTVKNFLPVLKLKFLFLTYAHNFLVLWEIFPYFGEFIVLKAFTFYI